jgi:hypothetical protein
LLTMRNHRSRVRTRNHSWRNKHFLRRKYSAGPENVAARQARTPHEPRPRRRTLPTNPAQRRLELNISQSVGRGRRAQVGERLHDHDQSCTTRRIRASLDGNRRLADGQAAQQSGIDDPLRRQRRLGVGNRGRNIAAATMLRRRISPHHHRTAGITEGGLG